MSDSDDFNDRAMTMKRRQKTMAKGQNTSKSTANGANKGRVNRVLLKKNPQMKSTPQLKGKRPAALIQSKGGMKMRASVMDKVNFNEKTLQSMIPNKMTGLQRAEMLVQKSREQIKKFQSGANKGGDIDEKLKNAMQENRFMQRTLRQMQESINDIFDKHDPVKGGTKSFPQTDQQKAPPKEFQEKFRSEEVRNAQQALQNMKSEYDLVKSRIEQIKDPGYISDLHNKLEGLNKEIKDIEKDNRDLNIEQKKRELDMEKLISQGAPDSMFKISELQQRVTLLRDQLRKEKEEVQTVEDLSKQLVEQEQSLVKKEQKLDEIGKKFGLDFNVVEDEKRIAKEEQLTQQYQKYDKNLHITNTATKTLKKKLKLMTKANKQRLSELQIQKAELQDELRMKRDEVLEKNQMIGDMIEKGRSKRYEKVKKASKKPKKTKNYDAVQQAIEEMDEKEHMAAYVIQKWWEGYKARKAYRNGELGYNNPDYVARMERERAQVNEHKGRPSKRKSSGFDNSFGSHPSSNQKYHKKQPSHQKTDRDPKRSDSNVQTISKLSKSKDVKKKRTERMESHSSQEQVSQKSKDRKRKDTIRAEVQQKGAPSKPNYVEEDRYDKIARENTQHDQEKKASRNNHPKKQPTKPF